MYGIVVILALGSGAQAADCCGWGNAPAYWGGWNGYWAPRCCSRYGCGKVTPAQVGWGTSAPQVSAEEQKKWDDYVASLDNYDDQRAVNDLWERADLGARKKLISKIPPPIKAPEKE
jgi:hypothetical protein